MVITYQGVQLVRYHEDIAFFKKHSSTYLESVLACLHSRLKPQNNSADVETLTCALTLWMPEVYP